MDNCVNQVWLRWQPQATFGFGPFQVQLRIEGPLRDLLTKLLLLTVQIDFAHELTLRC